MNRIINIVVFLLVLLHVLSLLCGCSRDAGQSETTDAGQSGTSVPTVEVTDSVVQTETEAVTEEIPPFELDLSSPMDFWYMQDSARNDPPSRLSFLHTFGLTEVIGDERAEIEAVDTWFRDMGTLSLPQIGGTPTASYDIHERTLTFQYNNDDGSPCAILIHRFVLTAEEIHAELGPDSEWTPLDVNPTADTVYLYLDDDDGMIVTVLYGEQVIHLLMYGDDTELLTAKFADLNFHFTLDDWSIADFNGIPYSLEFSYPNDLKTVLSLPEMTDAELDAFSQTDSRFMNGLHTHDDAVHVADLVSRVAFPRLQGMIAPETFTVYPEPDRASVLIPLTLDGTRAGQVIYDFEIGYSAVKKLYLSRLRDGARVSDHVTAWMQIGENQYCAEVWGVYVTLIIWDNAFKPEDVTFGTPIQSLSHPTIDRSHIQYAYVAELESKSRIHLVQLKSPDIDVAAYLTSYAAENASFAKIGYDISAPLDETTVYIDQTADGKETDVQALQTGDIIGWIPNGAPMETYPAGYSDAPQYIEILRHTNQE